MPQYIHDDLFRHLRPGDTLLVTTNSMIKKNGALAMGRGIAKVVRNRWRGIDHDLGRSVAALGSHYGLTTPECVVRLADGYIRVLGFQTKYSPWQDSTTALIDYSIDQLMLHLQLYPHGTYHLPYPGIGYGGLSPEQLQDALDALPNRVCIYQYQTRN